MSVHDLSLGDEDSLFGSPPPSPPRGRSPPLALPSGHTSQNVGTIALPGSHIYSESPVHPLASSWRVAPEEPPRPPAHPAVLSEPAHATQQRETTSKSSSRASSVTAKKKKTKQKKSTPSRPLPPPFSLPDPNAPPPTNFLRNQQALLGMAGLVGGVNLAALSTKRPVPGSTCRNPIVVDDGEGDQPRLGRNAHSTPPIDPTFLAPPSQEQMIESLVKQKNIFPVLESLLKLLGAGGSQPGLPPCATSECRRQSKEPQKKRRKLSSVPAGAADWDVPYPFPEGEGPTEYRTNWERDRCRQLIAQLVSSLKSAARTAAAKTYKHTQKLLKDRSTAPSAISNPLPSLQQVTTTLECRNPQPTHIPALTETTVVSPTSYDAVQDSTSISQLQSDLDQLFQPLHTQNFQTSELTNAPLDDHVPEMDPAFYDSWKSLLKSFNTDDFQQFLGESTPSMSNSSDAVLSLDSALESSAAPISHDTTPEASLAINFPDLTIDPILLAISNASTAHLDLNPSLVRSPLQSTSSVTDTSTPNWEFLSEDREICNSDPVEESLMVVDKSLLLSGAYPMYSSTPTQCPTLGPDSTPAITATVEYASEHIDQASQPPSTVSIPQSTLPVQELAFSTESMSPITTSPSALATTSSGTTSGLGRTNAEPRSREAILRCARERRRQLTAEIERAKVELWETTIEQAVLAHIAKEKP